MGFMALIVLGGLSAPNVRADFILHPWENRSLVDRTSIFQRNRFLLPVLSVQATPMYYTSAANFSPSGDLFHLDGSKNSLTSPSYQRAELDLTLEGQLSPDVGVFGRFAGGQSQLGSNSRWSLLDQSVGFDVHLLGATGDFSLNFQFQLDFPGYPLVSTDNPPVGDHSLDVTGGLFANFPILVQNQFSLSAIVGAGYTHRSVGFSAAVPWSATLFYRPLRHGITASWMMSGIVSLNTDNRPADGPSDVSLISGGINPSIIQIQGKLGYQIEMAHEVNLAVGQSIWGQEIPNGTQIILGYQYRLIEARDTNPLHQTAREFAKSNAGFLTYSLDAHILNTNDRLNLVKIDKGREDGVEVAQIFDIFVYDNDHKIGAPVARGAVSNARLTDAAIEIIEYYKDIPISPDFLAKRLVR